MLVYIQFMFETICSLRVFEKRQFCVVRVSKFSEALLTHFPCISYFPLVTHKVIENSVIPKNCVHVCFP